MRRLREGQRVELALGGFSRELACQVVGVEQGELALVPASGVDVHSMAAFRTRAMLAFRHVGTQVVLKGHAVHHQGDAVVRFGVEDGVVVPEARSSTRVPLDLALDLTLLDEDGRRREAVQTRTADVSVTGVGARTVRFGALGRRVDVRLALPGEAPLLLEGRIDRHTPWVTGVGFRSMAGTDRARLAAFLLARQRERLRRPPGVDAA